MLIGEQIEVIAVQEFAAWLAANGSLARDIWVIIYKKAGGKQTVTYGDLRDTAMCYGWVDVLNRTVDAERYALHFMPRRKQGSTWNANSRATARRLLAEGRITEVGKAVLPDDLLLIRTYAFGCNTNLVGWCGILLLPYPASYNPVPACQRLHLRWVAVQPRQHLVYCRLLGRHALVHPPFYCPPYFLKHPLRWV